jgi:hypothetical protein
MVAFGMPAFADFEATLVASGGAASSTDLDAEATAVASGKAAPSGDFDPEGRPASAAVGGGPASPDCDAETPVAGGTTGSYADFDADGRATTVAGGGAPSSADCGTDAEAATVAAGKTAPSADFEAERGATTVAGGGAPSSPDCEGTTVASGITGASGDFVTEAATVASGKSVSSADLVTEAAADADGVSLGVTNSELAANPDESRRPITADCCGTDDPSNARDPPGKLVRSHPRETRSGGVSPSRELAAYATDGEAGPATAISEVLWNARDGEMLSDTPGIEETANADEKSAGDDG